MVVLPTVSSTEREVLAARLVRVADPRNALRLLAAFCRQQLAGDAALALLRDRRTGAWLVAARSGEGLSVRDAALLEDVAAREPPERLHRISRPLRPHGRLAGGVVVRREHRLFRLRDAARLGRLCRIASAELERRDRLALGRAVHRLDRKLARGVAAIDAIYHALDEAVRLVAADHSTALLVQGRDGRWRIRAEKLAGGRSPRIGVSVDDPVTTAGGAPAGRGLAAQHTSRAGRRLLWVVRSSGGDPFDEFDREVLERLSQPVAAAVDRLRD